ncbi:MULTISPECIES: hypothetical protein [unclassified Arthrobacter]|uniref:hypothetical protein n=1 Tax=unclassified Arthrobacter TaxID=235627 RepID=UPI0028832E4F|nr:MULTISPECIES: hypothetical protein [unclassified Arthrobacter]
MSGTRARAERRLQQSEPAKPRGTFMPVHGEPDVVHFYIPLPDPIKVPHRTQLPVRYVWNPISDNGPCFRPPSQGNVNYAARQIVIFHQGEVSVDIQPFEAAMKIMALALERSGSSGKAAGEKRTPPLPIAHTTVEVVCVLDPSQADPVDHAFEHAIDVLTDFQTYYHLFTKIPTRRLTRKLLPPFIPMIHRMFGTPDKWEGGILHVNDGGTALLAASTPTMSADQLINLLESAETSGAEIFKSFTLMRQEALVSYAAGANSATSLFIAIAAETLLTELFLLLSWEEDADLKKTADILGDRDNISRRLLNELAFRLKGDWDRDGNGPIGEWQRQIANLRNKVAHAGTIPSDFEIQSALNALSTLDTHVGDQLVKSLNKYPFAVNKYLGADGLVRRKKLKRWQEFAAKVQFPRHASHQFARWKKEVERIRLGPFEGRLENCMTSVVLFGNGAERWYLVDDDLDLACPIDAPELDSGTVQNLDKIRAEKHFDVQGVALPSCRPVPPVDPHWVPSYQVIPLAGINRWEQCMWVPPT